MGAQSLDLTASMEDYLEAILRLSRETRVIRMRDIAKALGVTPPSATGAVQSLKDRGLVSHEKYEDVLLTDEGQAIAEAVHKRHEELRLFFVAATRARGSLTFTGARRYSGSFREREPSEFLKFIQ